MSAKHIAHVHSAFLSNRMLSATSKINSYNTNMPMPMEKKKSEIKKRDRSRDDRIFICYGNDKDLDYYVERNEALGYVLYFDKKRNEVFVRRDISMVYRAPDAEFKKVKDGLYSFVGPGEPIYVGA